MRKPFRLTILAAAAAAAGCAITPQAERQLEEARAAYRFASESPHAKRYAAPELAAAGSALKEAERLAAEGGPTELVEHNAYLAEQRSRIALSSADTRQAEVELAAAREQRRRTEIQARELEAAQARAQAQQAEIAHRDAELRAEALEKERLEKERLETQKAQEKQALAATELSAEVKRLEAELADVRAKQTDRGWILTLKNELLFDSGGATLKSGAQRALDNLAQFLRKYPDRDIAIEGFTDSLGSRESNQRLSERRAESVKDALVARGIEPRRIDARGYGPSFPVASNATETGRQLNRRVEIVINPS